MRLSVVTFLRPGTEPRDRPLGGIVDPRDDTLLLCELTTRVR